jgi:IclR family acetate operon transcriptional repressor
VTEQPYAEVQSVARAARLLLAFTTSDRLGPTEAAKLTGLHKSVTHRLLFTLAASGLLVKDPLSGLYQLGPVMARLTPPEGANGLLARVARPYLQRLSDRSGETISLCVVDGTQGLCIDVIDSTQSMRFTVHKGETFPLNAGCIGKVLLAFQPAAFIEALIQKKALKRYTANTITDSKALRTELDKIRRVGFGFSDSEITPQSRSVGAPVYGADGKVLASLVASAPAFRLPDPRVPALVQLVVEQATLLSLALGHTPASRPAGRRKSDKEKPHALQ